MTTQTKFGRYVIKCLMQKKSGEWAARAFRDEIEVGEVKTAATEHEAILAVKSELEAIRRRRYSSRGPDGYPTAEEVRLALRVIDKQITKSQRDMLHAHLEADGYVLTATQIAAAGGYASYEAANSQYGQLGRKLAEELEWTPPVLKQEPTWTYALAKGANEDGGAATQAMQNGHWRWRLRPELVEALRD